MAVRDSASARLSTAMAKNTFKRISANYYIHQGSIQFNKFCPNCYYTRKRVSIYLLLVFFLLIVHSCDKSPEIFLSLTKDTITAYKENNEINTCEHAYTGDTAVSSNPNIHHGIPILAG